MSETETVDVLICGAGPVGLLTALGLAQNNISTMLIEKRERNVQEQFGRACTLYPRTVELLETVGVVEDMLQIGFHGRSYAVFREGKRVTRKAWQNMFPMIDNSFHNYILNIRQSRSEDIFASRYRRFNQGHGVRHGWELEDSKVEDLDDGHNVTAIISHANQGKRRIRCKYLVGSDGGNSTVRYFANVDMEGNETTYRWVRIDGKIKTNIPEPNLVFAALETKSHGNVLWAKLDRDASRVGFALTAKLQEKYPNGITQEQAVEEAREALKPFSFEMERLDWWTQYNVKQKVAETFQKDKYILLAGDAAHTHSSAFAQGMNTGVHDATNLAWKLAGTIKGWYTDEILATYASECHAAASRVVSVDRMAAAAVSGEIPAGFAQMGLTNEDALGSIMAQNMSLTTGLGISYTSSAIVSDQTTATTLIPGSRSPDALLKAPGTMVPLRLHDIINHRDHRGQWAVLVFSGYHHVTQKAIIALREAVSGPESLFNSRSDRFNLATILIGHVASAWEAFEGPALGRMYFDPDATAHDRYCVYPENGAIVVVRPDGIFAFATGLDEIDTVESFFKSIFRSD